MIDEHTREDELEILIIGLQGEIDKLKKEKQEIIEKFIKKLEKRVYYNSPSGEYYVRVWEIQELIKEYKKSL